MNKRVLVLGLLCICVSKASFAIEGLVFKAGHASLETWRLGDVPYPKENKPNKYRIDLGKKLFFDPRLSSDGNMSCASCHSPLFGWSDALPTAKGFRSKTLDRASPVITNTAYNTIQMWDGRKKTLEDQAMGPMESSAEMNMDIPLLVHFLKTNSSYKDAFNRAYPGEAIGELTIAKALASFQRTVISKNSSFDRWLAGDKKALSKQALRGFKVFVDPEKGNCDVCHSAPNFTDNGFHNIGLPSYGKENPDMGRYALIPVSVMKGAFKTPTLRDIEYSAPYFHDGSASTLEEVVEHYVLGGVVKTSLSPNMKRLVLSQQDKSDLVAFLKALSSPREPFVLPILPL